MRRWFKTKYSFLGHSRTHQNEPNEVVTTKNIVSSQETLQESVIVDASSVYEPNEGATAKNILSPKETLQEAIMVDATTWTHEIITSDKATQTIDLQSEEPDRDNFLPEITSLLPSHKKVSIYNKSHSLSHLTRLKTQKRVSIIDSDDDDSPWKIPPAFFKFHSQPVQSSLTTFYKYLGDDIELKAEIILNEKLREYFHHFMINQWVTAVDIGYREIHQQHTKLRCIKVYVKQKFSEMDIPRNMIIEKMIDGCPVDKVVGNGHLLGGEEIWVEYCRKRRRKHIFKSKAKERLSFLMINSTVHINSGDSIGHLKNQHMCGTVGTLLVYDSTIGLLTAGHIGGNIGTQLVSPAKREAKSDQTTTIAMTTISALTDEVNCAFARIDGHVITDDKIKGVCKAQVGDIVRYKGAGSGDKLACIESINWTGEIDGMTWNNQIQLSMPALPGDAGAVIIKDTANEIVGMIIANANKHAIANHIDFILTALDAVILPCQ